MSALHGHLADYLRVRRALGFRLERSGTSSAGSSITLTRAGSRRSRSRWPSRGRRARPRDGYSSDATASDPRLHAVPVVDRCSGRGATSDLLPDRRRRPVPFLYTDAEIAPLVQAAGTLRTPHRVATMRTLIGLLAVTGMRRGEALGLDRDDRLGGDETLTRSVQGSTGAGPAPSLRGAIGSARRVHDRGRRRARAVSHGPAPRGLAERRVSRVRRTRPVRHVGRRR